MSNNRRQEQNNRRETDMSYIRMGVEAKKPESCLKESHGVGEHDRKILQIRGETAFRKGIPAAHIGSDANLLPRLKKQEKMREPYAKEEG